MAYSTDSIKAIHENIKTKSHEKFENQYTYASP